MTARDRLTRMGCWPGDQAAHPGQCLDPAAGLVRPVRRGRAVAGPPPGGAKLPGLVELDYGGQVRLLSDDALSSD